MSHHFDTEIARDDPRLGICDVYLFRGRPGYVTMAMTVNPDAGVNSPETFHGEGLYVFRFDIDGDLHEEVSWKVRFGDVEHRADGSHVQSYEVIRASAPGPSGLDGEVVASGRTGEIVTASYTGSVRAYAGPAPDLFAANRKGLQRFRTDLGSGRFTPEAFQDPENFFADRNVTVIVLEVPVEAIAPAGTAVHAWATVSLYGHAPEVQVSRWGLPLMTHIYLVQAPDKEEHNQIHPAAETESHLDLVRSAIRHATSLAGAVEDPAAYADAQARRLVPSRLPYVLDTPAAFETDRFNGRALTDNVMDAMLSLLTGTSIENGIRVVAENTLEEFPYFGRPYPDPVGAE
ncbi:DUF4331 family protein [Nocardioides insulae]|uniref:DUF4331 family protein n=1 Tax=Nocardioides insulae TaxID=394734 RepID=UPI0005640CF8|nr:DUF4331 family protein [Nocardioides insulae]